MRLIPSAGAARWAPRVVAVLLFALFCAVVAYWALRLLEPPVRIAPSGSLAARETIAALGPAQSLFGRAAGADAPVAAAAASNFRVLGIIADPQRGAAVLSVDGGPPTAFGVGMPIDDQHTLASVSPTRVVIRRGDEDIALDAPAVSDIAVLTRGSAPEAAPRAEPPPALRPLPPAGADAGRTEAPQQPVIRRPPAGSEDAR